MKTRALGLLFPAAVLFASCASPEEQDDGEHYRRFENIRSAWNLRLNEMGKTGRQRAGLLPDALDRFASEDQAEWKGAKAFLEQLERREKGFVYDRIMEILPEADSNGEKGAESRKELVRIGAVIRHASRFHSDDREEWSRARIDLQALGEPGIDNAAIQLILKLSTQDADTILFVQEELVELGEGAIRHLALAISSAGVTHFVRERCIETLAMIGPKSLPALFVLLEPGSPEAGRYCATLAIARIGDPVSIGPLATAERREKNPLIRCGMIDALVSLGGPEAAEAALRALADEDLSVVKFGARAAARLHLRESVKPLIGLLRRTRDENAPDVRDEILEALKKVTGLAIGSDPDAWAAATG